MGAMSIEREMLFAWETIRNFVNFDQRPIWEAVAHPTLGELRVMADDEPPTLSVRRFEFSRRKGGSCGAETLGRLAGETEWIRLSAIPFADD